MNKARFVGLSGIPDWNGSTFYVPGERHENLPAGGFAGLGSATSVFQIWPDTRPPEYVTGGSGMFQGDFGGSTVVSLRGRYPTAAHRRGMGQDGSTDDTSSDSGDSGSGTSLTDLLSQGLQATTSVAQAVTPGTAAPAAAAAAKPAAAATAAKKLFGLPIIAVVAIAGAGAYFYMSRKKR